MKQIAFINLFLFPIKLLDTLLEVNFNVVYFSSIISFIEYEDRNSSSFDLFIFCADIRQSSALSTIQKVMPYLIKLGYPTVLFSEDFTFTDKKLAVKEGISCIFKIEDVSHTRFLKELLEIIDNPPIRLSKNESTAEKKTTNFRYEPPIGKRVFDVTVSGLVLFVFFPIYAIVALLIRLESKGPIFYISKRVGAGFQIFNFYKFRTMTPDADKKLNSLSHLNQYTNSACENEMVPTDEFFFCTDCKAAKTECENMLYDDTGLPVCEKVFLINKKNTKETFFKISNDPRITKLGKFLRNSSLDEIPQLFNVFKGDMSIVGNRPLPLYEAEMLTNDMFAQRFLAPAGLTGLWQVTKRGKVGLMSEEERIGLDNAYAQHYSILFDIKIILKTIPALFQKENV